MSRIRGKNTRPELAIRQALWRRGLRYRLHHKLPGRPDIVFVKPRVAVFVDGCFWHGCPQHGVRPQTNRGFWDNKIRSNRKRDEMAGTQLESEGWVVLRFWEHEVKADLPKVTEIVFRAVNRSKERSGEPVQAR